MKTIKNGLEYDTDEATKLCCTGIYYRETSDGGLRSRDTLYRTRNGRFFEHCEYLPETNFIRKLGSGAWTLVESIHPRSEQQAAVFCHQLDVKINGVPQIEKA